MWQERIVGIHIPDPTGFERTIGVLTTDLSIPNRRPVGVRLEFGLLPIRAEDRNDALKLANDHASEELYLMLMLGFFTGMRIGTIADLKVQTLDNAVPDPAARHFFKITVGPGAHPPVAVKLGVTGQISLSSLLLNRLRDYATGARRLKREIKASLQNKDLLFLTRFGNSFCQNGVNNSNAINVEMHSFREKAKSSGLNALRDFHFHQSRCTFATELARLAIRVGGSMFAISMVKRALLVKSESTALHYIRFVEETPIKEQAANDFTREFLGLVQGSEGATNGKIPCS
ncbi:site-specific integrase [Paraburkholderia fungorum]|nr:site-specific integrase [Paraburkholderia fungorum]